MLQGQQYLGTVQSLADEFGCSEQLADGLTIIKILRKRMYRKGLVRSLPSPESVKVYVSTKMQTCGGRAYYSTGHIAIHEALVGKPELRNEFCITLLHEYAHIIAHNLYLERGHGNSWRYVMQLLDLKPTVYHSNVQDFAAFKAAKGEVAIDELMDEFDL